MLEHWGQQGATVFHAWLQPSGYVGCMVAQLFVYTRSITGNYDKYANSTTLSKH